jgi:hypothetical protein
MEVKVTSLHCTEGIPNVAKFSSDKDEFVKAGYK